MFKRTTSKQTKRVFKYIAIVIVIVSSMLVVFNGKNLSITKRPSSYDEKMWTNVGIASYAMFTGYQRKNIEHDSWFLEYAYQEKLDIFKFSKENNNLTIDYDKIPIQIYQWFDGTLWTFGWKVPNLSKLLKGWYINFRENDVNPEGYYELGIAENSENTQLHYSRVPDKFIEDARHVDSFFCFLSLLLVFFIGWQFFNFMVGSFSWLYLLLNESYVKVTTASGMDSTLFFFSLLTIFIFLFFFRKIRIENFPIKKSMIIIATLGITMGLLISSKYNGATLFYETILLAISFIYILWKNYPKKEVSKMEGKRKIQQRYLNEIRKERSRYLFKWTKTISVLSAIIVITSMTTFMYINPQLRTETTKKVKIIRESVDAFLEIRARSANTIHLKNSFKESMVLTINSLYFSTNPENFFLGTFGNLLETRWKFLDALFLLIGLYVLMIRSWKGIIKKKKINSEYIILTSFIIIFIMNADFIWTTFTRYFLPFFIAGSFVIAIGMEKCVNALRKKISLIRS